MQTLNSDNRELALSNIRQVIHPIIYTFFGIIKFRLYKYFWIDSVSYQFKYGWYIWSSDAIGSTFLRYEIIIDMISIDFFNNKVCCR